MRYLLRVMVLLVIAVAVGWSVDRLILRHSTVRDGGYGPQVKLGAATGGLFAAGAAVTMVVIAMAMGKKE